MNVLVIFPFYLETVKTFVNVTYDCLFSLRIFMLYTVSQKGYHPTTNDNFNNSCISVILLQILLSKYVIEKWLIYLFI